MLVKWMNYLILCCRKSLGMNTYCFPHYEDEDVEWEWYQSIDGDTTFEQYIAMKRS